MDFNDFLSHLEGVKGAGASRMARCPAHDDNNPSLSISEGTDGCILLKCFAGCDIESIVAALGLKMSDLMPDDGNVDGRRNMNPGVSKDKGPQLRRTDEPTRKIASPAFLTATEAVESLERSNGQRAAMWTYHDGRGEPIGVVVRWDSPDGGKAIRPVSKGPDGQWRICAMPTLRPLYELPDLADADCIYVCEGEKAADAGQSIGFVATTSSGGSNAAGKSDWRPLAGKQIVIIPDNDPPGEKYAKDVIEELSKLRPAPTVKVVRLADQWTDLPTSGDLADIPGLTDNKAAIRAEIERMVAEAEPVDIDATTRELTTNKLSADLVCLADIEPEEIEWLWPDRIAIGKLTMIAGDPGLGKSFVTLDIASRVSRGTPWPCTGDTQNKVSGVVILSAEDDPADTIRPRLDAAGADVTRISIMRAARRRDPATGEPLVSHFNLATDVPALRDAIRRVEDCRLVVIDPISAYCGNLDSHKNTDVRGILAPLSELAAELRVAVVAVSHLNKSTGGPAIYRTMGSLAFVAAGRAAWVIVKDKNDPLRRLMLPTKINNAPDAGSGLAYSLRSEGTTAVVAWEAEPVNITADEAVRDNDRGGDSGEHTLDAEWLRTLLADGPVPSQDVRAQANEIGLSRRALHRARAEVGAKVKKEAFSKGWVWVMPPKDEGPCEDDQQGPCPSEVVAFGESGSLRANDPKNTDFIAQQEREDDQSCEGDHPVEQAVAFGGGAKTATEGGGPMAWPEIPSGTPEAVADLARERPGWTAESWRDRLIQMAEASAEANPGRSKELRRAASMFEDN